jgi:hypothetical protein
MRGRRKVRQKRGVLDWNLLLVVIAVCHPRLHLGAIQRTGDKTLVEGVLVVVPLAADGVEPLDQAGAERRALR